MMKSETCLISMCRELEVPGRCETAGIQAFLEDDSPGIETIQISA
jgi:hypothetical protein